MKKLIISLVSLPVALFAAAVVRAETAGAPPQSTPLVIGAALHMTGEYAAYGEAFKRGIELAFDEVTLTGGVAGRPVQVIFEDTGYDMKRVHTITQKFISVDHVDAMMVSNYTEVMRVGPLLERAQVPTVTIWDSSPDIEALGRYVFGLGVWTPDSAQRIARYAREHNKAKRAVIVATEGEWSLKAAQYFSAEFIKQGGEVIKELTVLPQETDFRSLLTRIRALHPDVVYAPIADNIVAFFSQVAAARLDMPVVTSDVLTDEIVASLGARVDGVVQAQGGDAEGPLKKQLVERYRTRYGEECSKPLFVALGYDALRVLVEAARRAATGSNEPISRESITQQLYQVHAFPGATAEISISPEGSSRIPTTLMQATGGRMIPVQVSEPVGGAR